MLQRLISTGVEFNINQTMQWPESKVKDFVKLSAVLNIEILINGGVGHDEVTYSYNPVIRQKRVFYFLHKAAFALWSKDA